MHLNKLVFVLTSAILFVSLVSFASASFIQDITQPSVSSLSITITPTNSSATFNLNTAGQSWDIINVSSGPIVNYPFVLSSFLNGISFSGSLNQGSSIPQFSTVSIQPNTETSTLLDLMLSYYHYSFTSSTITPGDLTNLISTYSSQYLNVQNLGNEQFSKQGTTYTISYDKGFGSKSSKYMNNINNVISQYNNNFNLKNLIATYLLPMIMNNQNLSGYLNQFNYNTSIDLSQVTLKDGTYNVPVTFTSGTNSATEVVSLTLQGIPVQTPTPSNVVDSSGNFVPSDTSTIQSITGLTSGATVTFQVLSDPSSLGIPAFSQNGITAVQYFKIDVSSGASNGGTIFFNMNNPNNMLINLYVWDISSNSWQGPYAASLVSGSEYQVTVPHFSTYVVTQTPQPSTTPVTPTGYPYPGPGYYNPSAVASNNGNSPATNNGNVNQNTQNLNPSGITGGVIGALTSPGGITFLALLVVGIGAVLIVVVRRRMSKKKSSI